MNDASALTQFYIALTDIIYDLDGISLSAEISDYKNFPVVSWTHNDQCSYRIIERSLKFC